MPAITVDKIGVCYQRVRRREKGAAANNGVLDWLLPWKTGREDFWGLRDVSFTVNSGEILGIIGRNGAGKSTLLRVLTGILPPDEGSIHTTGRITALLSLGAGFLPDLSGRDNILLNGVYLGMPESEMLARMDDIIDFAGLGDFIDTPIRQYSSGMKARLGFSVASSLTPDILVLDEVLATSDREFQIRARERVDDLMQSAKAIVIVTHDLNMVENFCTRAILLDQGQILDEGEPVAVVKAYRDIHRQERKSGAPSRTTNHVVPENRMTS